jgi:hypothetical protein
LHEVVRPNVPTSPVKKRTKNTLFSVEIDAEQK